MAGGQERVLRRRIKSVQATRKITKAMELIAASQIARAQGRIAANRPYKDGMAAIIVEAAKGDPRAAKKMLGTPEKVENAVVLCIVDVFDLKGSLLANLRQIAGPNPIVIAANKVRPVSSPLRLPLVLVHCTRLTPMPSPPGSRSP